MPCYREVYTLPDVYQIKKYKGPLIGPNHLYQSELDKQNGQIISRLIGKHRTP